MVDAEFVLPWVQKAQNDIATAKHLAETMRPMPSEIICFHCQQAAEKYLKAFLVHNDNEPPKTHDLIELVKLCGGFDTDFSILTTKCEYLLPFAVHARYPGASDPDDEDARRALAFAQDVITFVTARLPLRSGQGSTTA